MVRLPNHSTTSGNHWKPVLEQDSLITGVKVRTDRLLTAPGESVHKVHLVIEVTVRVLQMSLDNLGFMGE
jgi:hypothetical protein